MLYRIYERRVVYRGQAYGKISTSPIGRRQAAQDRAPLRDKKGRVR